MKVCTAAKMREADKNATEKFNIPSILLMENAAFACALEIEHFDSFVILCGKGNNGGDGLSIARNLISKGKTVKIYSLYGNEFSGDTKINYDILRGMSIPFYEPDFDSIKKDILLSDCTIDAIFGTGFKGEIDKNIKEIIKITNEFSKYTLSVDIPSGVMADSGDVPDIAIKAHKTVTFGAYKIGLLMYPGADYVGEIVVSNITLPKKLLEDIKIEVLEKKEIEQILPKRKKNSQKGDYGKVFVIGGSVGMAGAVSMAVRAAFKVGTGIVTACVPYEINDIVGKLNLEAMTYPANFETEQEKIIAKMNDFDVILFGNGIGRESFVIDLLEKVLKYAKKPIVLDADGLFALSKRPEMLKECDSEIIITPHSMEMARLINNTVEYVEKNRLSISQKYVLENKLTLVLKGNHTIITTQDGKQSINMTGNSGMATAGSGDVLAGMIAGFFAQTKDSKISSKLGVYLHGLAGDKGAESLGESPLVATDIINAISQILPVEI